MKHYVFDVFGILINSETHDVYTDTLDIIYNLKRNGYKVYILSNVTPYGLEVLKNLIDVNIFDNMFLSCEMNLFKPSLEMFKKVIELIGDSPENIYYFDDKEKNIENSKKLGINAYLTTGNKIKNVMEELS